MLSFSVSSFERRLFRLAMAKLGDYLSLYGVLVIRRADAVVCRVFAGFPGEIRPGLRRRTHHTLNAAAAVRRGRQAP